MLVSIIIPTYNNCNRLGLCLQKVLEEIGERGDIEVIVVDNGSNDGTVELLQGMPVKVVNEVAWQSPYLCRNIGVQKSTGRYIILLDSNCIPFKGWLNTCIKTFKNELQIGVGAIFSGQIVFENKYDKYSRLSRFDILYSLGDKTAKEERQSMPGGQLLFDRLTYEYVGPFFSNVRSLGDIEWTNRAKRMGVQLKMQSELRVMYPPKTAVEVIRKMYRLGNGKKEIWAAQNRSFFQVAWFIGVCKNFLPPSPFFVLNFIKYNRQHEQHLYMIEIIAYCWLVKIIRALGMLFGKIIREDEFE